MSNGDNAGLPGGPNIVSLAAELISRGKVLPSVAQLAFTGEDVLNVLCFQTVSGTVQLRGRFLDALTSQLIPFVRNFPVTGFASEQIVDPPGVGYLIGLSVFFYPSVSVASWAAFLQTYVSRGSDANTSTVENAMQQGYTGSNIGNTWPYQAAIIPTDGPGFPSMRTGTTPAAGAEIVESVGTFTEWRPSWFEFTLVTSAVVQNRQVYLRLQRPLGTSQWFIQAPAAQPASTTIRYIFGVGMAPQAPGAGVVSQGSLPEGLRMFDGDRIGTLTTSIDAGDQYSAIHYQNTEFLGLI